MTEEPLRVGLFDANFARVNSLTLGGENKDKRPKRIQWMRNEIREVTFYTDIRLREVLNAPKDVLKIGLIVEPKSIRDSQYKKAVELLSHFDYLLTFDMELVTAYENVLYYPLGGSWIKQEDFGIHDKTKSTSLIGTQKRAAVGHKLRAAAARRFGVLDSFDVMGRGYKPIKSKTTGLSDYRYSVIIESCKQDCYFSEKLIDCLSQGTIPMYWGHSPVDVFDMNGIITFDNMEGLGYILEYVVSEWDYDNRMPSIKRNFETCKEYCIAEDNIYKLYPWIFDRLK